MTTEKDYTKIHAQLEALKEAEKLLKECYKANPQAYILEAIEVLQAKMEVLVIREIER